MVDLEWSENELARLHKLWTETELSTGKIASHLPGRTKNSVVSKVNRMREREGTEKWPNRENVVPPKSELASRPIVPPKARPLRRGASTLPPLESAE